jgi:iron-sulfur cluster assembly accessory protein
MPVRLTDSAMNALKGIVDDEVKAGRAPAGIAIRLLVQGGGCGGFAYGMKFEKDTRADDKSVDVDGIRLVVDPRSVLYIRGTEIDFVDGPMGRGFVFNNPNPTGTCSGCGHAGGH